MRRLASLNQRLVRFLTPTRIRAYPLVAFVVTACVALYDHLSGPGWLNGLTSHFGGDFLSFYTGGALFQRDYPMIQAVGLLYTAVFLTTSLLADLGYALADPRIRY